MRHLLQWFIGLSLTAATFFGANPCAAAEVNLSRVDAKFISAVLARPDLEVIEDTTPLTTWDDPQCQERRKFDVQQHENQVPYASYWVWLCHTGVLGVDGFDETVAQALQNLGHGDPDQTAPARAAEGWSFDIGGRRGRTITVINMIGSGQSASPYVVPTAGIRSRDATLNLAVVVGGAHIAFVGDPSNIEALKTAEKILRAADAVTPR